MSESPKERKVKKRAWPTYNFKADFALLMEDQNGLEPKKKKTKVHMHTVQRDRGVDHGSLKATLENKKCLPFYFYYYKSINKVEWG